MTLEEQIAAFFAPNAKVRISAAKRAMFMRMYGRKATGPLTPEEAHDADASR